MFQNCKMYAPNYDFSRYSCECKVYDDNKNTLKDYKVLENQRDVGQISLRQNINSRHVRIENISTSPVWVGVDIKRDHHNPPSPQIMLRGGEVRDIGINMPGERLQYLFLMTQCGKLLGDPHAMHNHMNQFSIIRGENNWWVMDFQHKGYRGAF